MTEFKETELDERAIKMAKVLSADAVEKAGSGHPGSPISLAPVAYTLYQHFIKHDPNDPNWEGRDRFILSGGHASLTQYVQLYFSGYGVTLDDLKNFRGGAATRTPGHPEYGLSVSSAVCLTRRPRRKIPRSTTRSGPSAVKATSRRASPARPLPWPPTRSSAT